MSSQNYFDLLADDENDEPTAVIARATLPSSGERPSSKKSHPPTATAIPPSSLMKPPPQPPETARELKSHDTGRGGRGPPRGGRGNRFVPGDRERDGLSREVAPQREVRDGSSRDRNLSSSRENNDFVADILGGGHGSGDGAFGTGHGPSSGIERALRGNTDIWPVDGNRGRGRSGGRGRERGSGDSDERPRRREFDRRSGSGFGTEFKRDGSGRGNWGPEADQSSHREAEEVTPKELEKVVVEVDEKVSDIDDLAPGGASAELNVEKEEEDNELTLDEYEKILEEKRKALSSSKAEERKVLADKAFESMQLVEKRNDEDVFIKLGSEKERKKKEREKEKEFLEKEEKARKTQTINEFLKPTDGEKFYGSTGGRGRGRGRGRSGEGRGAEGDRPGGLGARSNFGAARRVSAPRIEDPGQFPTLGAK